jgi:hypothetical protein
MTASYPRVPLILPALAALLLACEERSSKELGPPVGAPAAQPQPGRVPPSLRPLGEVLSSTDVKVYWPSTTSTVFETFDLAVGYGPQRVEGEIVLVAGDKAVPAGEEPKDPLARFAKGSNVGKVKMPVGITQRVTIQVLDEQGRSRGPDWAATAIFTVVKEPPERSASILEPQAGARVPHRFAVKLGLKGYKTARNDLDTPNRTAGHFYIALDGDPIPHGMRAPLDVPCVHLDDGSLKGTVELPPGKHKLTAQFVDNMRFSYGPEMAHTIEVEVTPDR